MTNKITLSDLYLEQFTHWTGHQLGLCIRPIRDESELQEALQRGLAELYQSVFAAPPYNEVFTTDEVTSIFRDCLNKKGLIFMASEWKPDGKAVAFVSSTPANQEESLKGVFNDVANDIAYFAEDGVHIAHRRKGISAAMKDLLLTANEFSGYSKVLLRTSVHNYKQILAVAKSGGRPLSGVFQNVQSLRQDGTTTTDKRGFFMFESGNNQNSKVDNTAGQPLSRLTITRPGGNDTALVWDQFPREDHKSIAERIQTMLPGIEQVMFIEPGTKTKYRGQMAGGEFCGNATRSLGYMLLDGKPGTIDLEISGTDRIMTVKVTKDGAKTSVPILNDLNSVEELAGDYKVTLDGISFIVIKSDSDTGKKILSINDSQAQKDEVVKTLDSLGLTGPASGIIILSETQNKTTHMDPFVYVRSTGTVYYETACGSGASAVGMVRAKQSGLPVQNLHLRQPSGMTLIVNIDRDETAFKSATVNGPVDVIVDEKIQLPKNPTFPGYQKVG